MRTTLALDPDVFAAARSLAETQGKTLGRVVSELLRKALAPAPSAAEVAGFPVFAVPSDAPVVTPEAVRAALDDEP
ncbi:MAG: antitoxin [Thermoanaerobaculia bacterium]|nr:antitoxin [Thermoanaerobaculia bacterium]